MSGPLDTRVATIRQRANVRCAECLLRADCLCAAIPRVENRTEIVIIRHYAEEGRASNSGRFAAKALTRCRMYRYGAPGVPLPDEALAGDDTWLLFPEPSAPTQPLPRRIVVLDATWSQARRMRNRLGARRPLPVLGIAEGAREGRIRTLRAPPQPGQLPTLLAIAEALALVEGETIAAPLRTLWDTVVASLTADRRHPGRFIDR